MDIRELHAAVAQDDEVIDVPITKRDGTPYLAADGSPSTIGVVGIEAVRYREARHQYSKELIAAAQERPEGEKPDESFHAVTERRIRFAAGAVMRWHGWESEGEDWPCTPENIQALLQVEHILLQVESAVAKRARFFGPASKS